MTTKKQSVAEKIKKLLAMGERGSTPEERDAFMAQASKLMFEHAISEADLKDTFTIETSDQGDDNG